MCFLWKNSRPGVAHRAARYYKFDRKLYNKLHGMGKSFSPDEHNEIY